MVKIDVRRTCLSLTCAVALVSTRVDAESPAAAHGPEKESRPWAIGVPESEQALAFELYAAGNEEFLESRFVQALAKYKKAIQHWDHPAIRYNMAVALIHLDQPVAARDNLVRSLAHGPSALDGVAYTQALTYRKLLDAQLAHVTIICQDPAAEVTLDGKLVFIGPGEVDDFLLPGDHQIVASRPGFLTSSRTLVLVAGKRTSYDIVLTPEPPPGGDMVRRWARWKPWAVLAGGGAVIGLGSLSYVLARQDFAAFDRGFSRECPGGCTSEMLLAYPALVDQKSRAEFERTVAYTLLSTGAVVAVIGIGALIMNQPRLRAETAPVPVVTPTPGGASLSIRGRF
jgi:hypothetical protein